VTSEGRRDLEQELTDATKRLRAREEQFRLVMAVVIGAVVVATVLFLLIAWRGYQRLADLTDDNLTLSRQIQAGQRCLQRVLFIPPGLRADLTQDALAELCPDVRVLGEIPIVDEPPTTGTTAGSGLAPTTTTTTRRQQRSPSTTGRTSTTTTTTPSTTSTTTDRRACTTLPVVHCQL
jgi:hypothetical protein